MGTTTDVNQALLVSVTFDSLLSNPSQLQVTLLVSKSMLGAYFYDRSRNL